MLIEIAGAAACCSVAVRYTHRWAKHSPAYRHLLTEGKDTVVHTIEQTLTHAAQWNVRARDAHRRQYKEAHDPLVRAEAARHARRYQKNLDNLNAQLRRLDELNQH